MNKAVKIIGGLFLLGIAVQVIKGTQNGSPTSNSSTSSKSSAQATAPQPAIPLPEDQVKFLQIVKKAQDANRAAANDMQKGGARATREKEICAMLPQLAISNWIGEVYTITSNSDGKGVIELTLAPNVYVKTWSNALSDTLHHTMIQPGTRLFEKASQFKEGQQVKFSGSFVGDDAEGCLYESSLTLDGKLSQPEFIFRFDEIAALK